MALARYHAARDSDRPFDTLDKHTQNDADTSPQTKRWVQILVWSLLIAADAAVIAYVVRAVGDATSPLAANSKVVSDSKFIIERTPDPGPE